MTVRIFATNTIVGLVGTYPFLFVNLLCRVRFGWYARSAQSFISPSARRVHAVVSMRIGQSD